MVNARWDNILVDNKIHVSCMQMWLCVCLYVYMFICLYVIMYCILELIHVYIY